MPENTFHLLESLQRLDALLRRALARPFADPQEIARIQRFKAILRGRLNQLLPLSPAH